MTTAVRDGRWRKRFCVVKTKPETVGRISETARRGNPARCFCLSVGRWRSRLQQRNHQLRHFDSVMSWCEQRVMWADVCHVVASYGYIKIRMENQWMMDASVKSVFYTLKFIYNKIIYINLLIFYWKLHLLYLISHTMMYFIIVYYVINTSFLLTFCASATAGFPLWEWIKVHLNLFKCFIMSALFDSTRSQSREVGNHDSTAEILSIYQVVRWIQFWFCSF